MKIRIVTYGLPLTLARCNSTSRVPQSWVKSVIPFTTVGGYVRGAIARQLKEEEEENK